MSKLKVTHEEICPFVNRIKRAKVWCYNFFHICVYGDDLAKVRGFNYTCVRCFDCSVFLNCLVNNFKIFNKSSSELFFLINRKHSQSLPPPQTMHLVDKMHHIVGDKNMSKMWFCFLFSSPSFSWCTVNQDAIKHNGDITIKLVKLWNFSG